MEKNKKNKTKQSSLLQTIHGRFWCSCMYLFLPVYCSFSLLYSLFQFLKGCASLLHSIVILYSSGKSISLLGEVILTFTKYQKHASGQKHEGKRE